MGWGVVVVCVFVHVCVCMLVCLHVCICVWGGWVGVLIGRLQYIHSATVPSVIYTGGRAYGQLKKDQEASLDEMNRVRV